MFGVGPFRWWVTKSGIGYSWGIPGFHWGRAATGSRYVSFGIPGTGLYYVKYFKDVRPNSNPPQASSNRTQGLPASNQAVEPWWRQKNLP